jgi:hypothetical protein
MNKATAAVMAAMVIATSGCVSSRPYTKGEKLALGHAFVGQFIGDVGTTAYGLHKHDNMVEGNDVWGGSDDGSLITTMIFTKAAFIGGAYLIGEYKPDWRTFMFNSIGGMGDAFAAKNLYTINEYGD